MKNSLVNVCFIIMQAHWYNVKFRGNAFPVEIARRDDLVERPVSCCLLSVLKSIPSLNTF